MTACVWMGFLLFVAVMVTLDLGVFQRHVHQMRVREAMGWTVMWIVLAMIFNGLVYFQYENNWFAGTGSEPHALDGRQAAVQFFAGYLIEKSLSVDNLFVIASIFGYFHVPAVQQRRVLVWGILGAVVLRGLLIVLGAALVDHFTWAVYLFGGILIASALKMALSSSENLDPDRNLFVRLTRRVFPVVREGTGSRFFVFRDGRWAVTPLFLALVLVESSDVMFAIDSIPAVFAVTRDPYLVFTSNIFAILGLRSLYFVLSGLLEQFRYLKTSLIALLIFVGVKMLLSHHYPISTPASLAIILVILIAGVLASLLATQRERDESAQTHHSGTAVPAPDECRQDQWP